MTVLSFQQFTWYGIQMKVLSINTMVCHVQIRKRLLVSSRKDRIRLGKRCKVVLRNFNLIWLNKVTNCWNENCKYTILPVCFNNERPYITCHKWEIVAYGCINTEKWEYLSKQQCLDIFQFTFWKYHCCSLHGCIIYLTKISFSSI